MEKTQDDEDKEAAEAALKDDPKQSKCCKYDMDEYGACLMCGADARN